MNPYSTAALTYLEAGFSPLPAHGKLLIVKGASGRHPIATREQIEKWIKTHGPFNIALRLPPNVIALDIDAYKGDIEKLEKLEAELGPLPVSWNSDSRGGLGGKILYRIPDDKVAYKWLSNINKITIVQHTHRYVMVLPSANKESNSRYQWYMGLGGPLITGYQIPSIDELAELPSNWISALTKLVEPMVYENSEIFNDDLDIFNDSAPCDYMKILIDLCSTKIIDSYDSGLHDTALSIVGILVFAASEGHSGITTAIEQISSLFLNAPRNRDLGTEWNNILSFVLANVDVDSISEVDTCNLKINKVLVKRDKVMSDIDRLMGGTNLSLTRAFKLAYPPRRR